MTSSNNPLFEIGQVVATPGALEAMQRAGQAPSELLSKHVVGDWGVLDPEDKALNELAVKDGSRILSAYVLKTSVRLWVITEARGDDGHRTSTCLLLPDEY